MPDQLPIYEYVQHVRYHAAVSEWQAACFHPPREGFGKGLSTRAYLGLLAVEPDELEIDALSARDIQGFSTCAWLRASVSLLGWQLKACRGPLSAVHLS